MDPRAANTHAALFSAILELAATRPINSIPITEIVAKASVNRSSFYQHFRDREELLASAIESLTTDATRIYQAIPVSQSAELPAELVRFTSHFAEHADLYQQALGQHGSARVANRVRARTIALVAEGIELTQPHRTSTLPLDIEAAGTAGAILGIVEAWLSHVPRESSESAAAWIWEILRARMTAA